MRILLYCKRKSDDASSLANGRSIIDTTFLLEEPPSPTILSFQSGFSPQFFETTIQHQNFHQTREHASERQREGPGVKEKLSKHARLSARNLMKVGANHMGEWGCELIVERRVEKEKSDSSHYEW